MQRKYALIRVSSGDYLLPSNDQRWLWRIYTYEEDGSLFRGERQVKGRFWACARRPMPPESAILDEDFLGWGDWEFWAGPLNTRTAAIDEAMHVGEVAAMREP